MQVLQNVSLKQFNTFGVDAAARRFACFSTVEELDELLKLSASGAKRFILGGGSNLLFTCDVDGWVLKNELMGRERTGEDDDFVYLRAGAGENWHNLVEYCVANNWAGVENLSLIPGNVGATPMQNIGAYGVEIKDVVYEVEAYHMLDRTRVRFSNDGCRFGYRDSIFKQAAKGQFVIVSVTYRLRKKPVFHTQYGAIEQELERMGAQNVSIQAIAQAVINIRRSKLPDPRQLGNAGSFFKNPSVTASQFQQLQQAYPEIPAYPNPDGTVKLAAGWLIEQCGWKGYRKGDAGCHRQQALVLVNYGTASGQELLALSEAIRQSVQNKFGVDLEREVNVV
ncbi:MAG TPA: UDP-N-acetylmuramate dehydrogenase [Lacibacter sp.]|nr:UDP-N-acetylmuramate dehydrogenase [Lacibacter sp.]HMO89124.1 UDP-N-acetylmuramate dehydrogenase [Lacibacter sp.]HMP86655.1 UDP-N-acetylmuramate dehydrogenase [Lacibacter sp.]